MKPGPKPKLVVADDRPSRRRTPLATAPTVTLVEPAWQQLLPSPADAEVREVAANTWHTVTSSLDPVGALSPLDMDAVADYAVCVGRLWQAERRLSEDGITLTGRDGNMIRHPLWSSLNQLRAQARALGAVLGVGVGNRLSMTVRTDNRGGGHNPFDPDDDWASDAGERHESIRAMFRGQVNPSER